MLVFAKKTANKNEFLNAKLAAIRGFSILANELIFCLMSKIIWIMMYLKNS